MPIGSYAVTPLLAHALLQKRPDTVLDLGIGLGFNGACVRQWCDMGIQPWHTRLTGVEGFAAYRNPLWDLYDRLFEGRIEAFPYDAVCWDFVVMTDVLEHFEKVEGHRQVERALEHLCVGGEMLISTPAVWMEQGAAHGNELETHRSLWIPADMRRLGFEVVRDGELPDEYGHRMLVATYTKK